jgi:hypothetical protein
MSSAFVGAAVAVMLASAPPGRSRLAGAEESPEDGRSRYAEIAAAVAEVVFDPGVAPLFPGDKGRLRTGALLLAIALHESGFRRDVDLGIGPHARGSGVDSCLTQQRIGRGSTPEGWTHEDLVSDRRKCFLAALGKVKKSLNACRMLPLEDRLAAYASGRCTAGRAASRARMKTAEQFAARIAAESRHGTR